MGIVACCSVVSLPGILGNLASATTGHRDEASASTLSRGLRFYRGKTITYIVPAAAGSQSDEFGREVTPLIGDYLHATVDVIDVAAGGQIAGSDEIAHAAPNGLTFGSLAATSAISDAITNTPGFNFNPERLPFIGSTGPINSVWVASKNSPYTSWRSLFNATPADPVVTLTESSGALLLNTQAVFASFGISYHLITGYSNSTSILAGFVRGDGPETVLPITVGMPEVIAGVATPLLLGSPISKKSPEAKYLSGVPTVAELGSEYASELKTPHEKAVYKAYQSLSAANGQLVATAVGTPAPQIAALSAALKWALTRPSTQTFDLDNLLSTAYLSGPAAKVLYTSALKESKVLAPYATPAG
jgi:tripartite-type tricarboxylate transporter receptor subunit TctC